MQPAREAEADEPPKGVTPMGVPRKPIEPATPEAQAFLEMAMEQYGKATYNFAYRLTGNEADARDLAQDAFIRVYRAWRSFQPGHLVPVLDLPNRHEPVSG